MVIVISWILSSILFIRGEVYLVLPLRRSVILPVITSLLEEEYISSFPSKVESKIAIGNTSCFFENSIQVSLSLILLLSTIE